MRAAKTGTQRRRFKPRQNRGSQGPPSARIPRANAGRRRGFVKHRRREPKIATAAPNRTDSRRQRAEALAEELFLSHRQRLLAIAKRNCNNPEDAEEAVQDAFLLFINHFNPNSSAPPLAWLTLTLKRECWARYRKAKRSTPLEEPKATDGEAHNAARQQPNPQEAIESADAVADARRQLAQLKPAERKALGLFAAGYSYREIATMTGWTYTKVNRCITEGRSSLRKLA